MLGGGERRGDAEERDDVLAAEGLGGDSDEERGVDATRVGDAEAAGAFEGGGDGVEGLALGGGETVADGGCDGVGGEHGI